MTTRQRLSPQQTRKIKAQLNQMKVQLIKTKLMRNLFQEEAQARPLQSMRLMTRYRLIWVSARPMQTAKNQPTAAQTSAAQTQLSACMEANNRKMSVSLALSACRDAVFQTSALTSWTAIKSARATPNAKIRILPAVPKVTVPTQLYARATKVTVILARSHTSAAVTTVTKNWRFARDCRTSQLLRLSRTFG